MKTIATIFILFLSIQLLVGNDQPLVYHFSPDTIDRNINALTEFAYMYMDSTRSMTIEDIKNIEFDQKADFSIYDRIFGDFEYPVWVKVTIRPSSPLPKDSIILNVSYGVNYQLYQVTKDTTYAFIGGTDSKKNDTQLKFCKYSFSIKSLDTIPNEIYIRYPAYSRSNLTLALLSLEKLEDGHAANFYSSRGMLIYYVSFISAILFLGLFFLVRFIIHSQKYILYYALYLISLGMVLLINIERLGELHIFWTRFHIPINVHFMTIPLVFLFFALYIKHLLRIDKQHDLYSYYKWFLYALGFTFTGMLLLFLGFELFHIRYPLVKSNGILFIPLCIAAIILNYKILVSKDKIQRLVGLGMSAIAIACTFISILMVLKIHCRYNQFLELSYMVDIFFLTLALGQRDKVTHRSLLKTQNDLLQREKENLMYQQKINSELTQLVEEKTKDIIATNNALADQEKLKLEAELNEKIAHAELKALKAQMNPHFIFNCLNAIRNLIQKEKTDLAIEYLTYFASFIRKVLQYSNIKQISLDEELELCELYLKMEQMRFEGGFDYQIEVEPNTPTDFIMLPPMLLQPLLENAIWHGLLHKKEDRFLSIRILQKDDQIICSIDDNGVGRIYAGNLKNGNKKDSVGLKLFIDRLDVNNQLLNNNYRYEIIDKYNNHVSTGTKVNLFFEL